MLGASVVWAMLGPQTGWPRLINVALEAGTLLLALTRSGRSVRLQWLAAAVGVLMVAISLGSIAFGGPGGLAALAEAALAVTAAVAIFAGLARQLTMTLHSIMGALCVYLLVGVFYASLDQAVAAFTQGPYFTLIAAATRSHFTYFSFVTLTTTGYGDFTPATSLGRLLAIAEALMGQLYLVSVVALVVGNVARTQAERT